MYVFDNDNFEDQVLNSDELVLVDFWSPKCEPCVELMPEIEALAERYGDKLKFGKIDVSQNRRLSIDQKVLGLPTILFYKNGKKIARVSTGFTAEDVEVKINKLLN